MAAPGTLTQGDIRAVLATSWGYVFAGMAFPIGGVVLTTDDGETWAPVSGGSIDHVNCLGGNHMGTVFAGLSIFGLARSIDSGYNWSTVGFVETEVFALGINREATVFAGTWLEGVYRSTNNGDSWVGTNAGLPPCHPWNCPVKCLAFDSTGTTFAAPEGAGIYFSTNNGNLWQHFAAPAAVVQSLAIHNSGAIFAGTGNGVFRSTSNGTTWSQDPIGNVTCIAISNAGHLFAGTFATGVFRSIDSGATWQAINEGLTNLNIRSLTATPAGYLFAGTVGSGVFRTAQSTNSAPASYGTIPSEYVLRQNYPNPFNPTTTIGYEAPLASKVTLKVYDVLGREVRTLVDEEKVAGYYEAVLDASDLASGVYLYRMRAQNYQATKQLLVVK